MSRETAKNFLVSAGILNIAAIFVLSILSWSFLKPLIAHASSASPGNGVAWPVCSSEEQWYCIESGSRDFVSITDGEGGEDIEEGGTVSVHANLLDANSVNWDVRWSSDGNTLPDEVADQTFRFTLRTGALEPNFTYALSDEFYLSKEGNADDGYKFSIEATPTRINWLTTTTPHNCFAADCGDETTEANINNRVISGNTQNMAAWDPGERDVWKGMYLSSNAQYRSTVPIYGTFPAPYWSVDIGNPHLTMDEEVADGSFTAWVPQSYFNTLSTTAAEAVENGFSITRDDDGDVSTVPGAASLVDGGAYLRIPSISYSSPTLRFSSESEDGPSIVKPGAPAATAITAKPGGLKVDWNAPHFNGGATITNYRLTCSQAGHDYTTLVAGTLRTATITGMDGGEEADCSVKAINSAGSSNRSNVLSGTPNDPLTNEEDMNNDNIEDADQPNVEVTTNSVTGKTVVLELHEDCDIQEFAIGEESDNETSDSGFAYGNGLVDFTAECDTPGQTAQVKLYFYNVDDGDFTVRKYNPNTNSYFNVDDAELSTESIFGNDVLTATYNVTDGEEGDVDGDPNGVIVDPVGLATSDVGSPNTGLRR